MIPHQTAALLDAPKPPKEDQPSHQQTQILIRPDRYALPAVQLTRPRRDKHPTTISPTNPTLVPSTLCSPWNTRRCQLLPQQQHLYVHISRQLIQHCQDDGNKFTTEMKKAHVNVKRPPHMHVYVHSKEVQKMTPTQDDF